MSGMERLYQIDQILANRNFVPRKELQERLGVSWATLKRDLNYLKDRLNAPVIFDRDLGGYRYDKETKRVGPQFELPGLWFSAEEIHALLTMQHLLSNLDTGGLLGPQIKPLLARLTGLLGSAENPAEEVQRRIKVQTVGARHFHLDHFQGVGSALLRRKRLVYYRDNWYLDAWCHMRQDLRAFAVDAIEQAEILDTRAKDVSEKRLDEVLGSGYGIFSGDKLTWAMLRFTPERAKWVASERRHASQEGHLRKDGSYDLKLPCTDDRELLMDIIALRVNMRPESQELKCRPRLSPEWQNAPHRTRAAPSNVDGLTG